VPAPHSTLGKPPPWGGFFFSPPPPPSGYMRAEPEQKNRLASEQDAPHPGRRRGAFHRLFLLRQRAPESWANVTGHLVEAPGPARSPWKVWRPRTSEESRSLSIVPAAKSPLRATGPCAWDLHGTLSNHAGLDLAPSRPSHRGALAGREERSAKDLVERILPRLIGPLVMLLRGCGPKLT